MYTACMLNKPVLSEAPYLAFSLGSGTFLMSRCPSSGMGHPDLPQCYGSGLGLDFHPLLAGK